MTITETRDEYAGARENAKGWFEEIRDAYRCYERNRDDTDGDEKIEERMRESVLSVAVRSGWGAPGETLEPEEYELLLTTGGPALRIRGDLNAYGEPMDAQLQMQDWGTPWREVWPCELDDMREARDALMWFASLFYYVA